MESLNVSKPMNRRGPRDEAGPRDATVGSQTLFHLMRESFDRARERNPEQTTEQSYLFAGRNVRIRIVGRELAEILTRPFRHLSGESAEEHGFDLEIDVWDSRTKGSILPSVPRVAYGSSWVIGEGRFTAFPDGRFLSYHLRGSMMWLDRQSPRLVVSTSVTALSHYERSKPFHVLLSVWYYDQGLNLVHGGMARCGQRGVLFAGPKAAGKSTSVLSCACAGWAYLGDDYIAVEETCDGTFVGYSVYASGLLEPDHMKQFPILSFEFHEGRPEQSKNVLLLADTPGVSCAKEAPVSVLVLPRVVDAEETSVREASKGEALLALAPTSLLRAPRPGRDAFKKLAQLVDRVPCFWMNLGRDITMIPGCARDLLERLPIP